MDSCASEMLSTESILPAGDHRLRRLKRVAAHISFYPPYKLFLLVCIFVFFCCCRPAAPYAGRWSACAATSFACVVVLTLPTTNLHGEAAAGELQFGPDEGEVDSGRNRNARSSSSSSKNTRINTRSSRHVSDGGTNSKAVKETASQEKTAGGIVKATAGDRSSRGAKATKEGLQSRKTSDEQRRQTRLGRKEDQQGKGERILKEMEELLSENASWRKLQAQRQAEEDLKKYADEGQLDVERFDAWREAHAEYKKQRGQASALQIGAAASGVTGAAGVLGLYFRRRQGVQNPEEARAHRRYTWVLSTAGLLGLLGAAVSLLGRRHLKKLQQLSERRLTRMENEAHAGVVPRLQPTLGIDQIPERETRRGGGKRHKKRQSR